MLKFYIIFLGLCTFSSAQTRNGLPRPEVFLEQFFNATTNNITRIVENFIFNKVKDNDVNFILHNKNGSTRRFQVNTEDEDIINKSSPIKIIISGWKSSGGEDLITDMVKAYHAIGIVNVFSMDWSELAVKDYILAASSSKDLGRCLTTFVLRLIDNDKNLLENVHLIGHSLGAHIAGFAGKALYKIAGVKFGRITALDAAGPLFEIPIKMPTSQRLVKSDANFVDIIHTDAGFLGTVEPSGHADIYVNLGGPLQPGCLNLNFLDSFACSHSRSYELFTKSIITKKYKATPCRDMWMYITFLCVFNDRVIVGEHMPKNSAGNYYINENFDDEN